MENKLKLAIGSLVLALAANCIGAAEPSAKSTKKKEAVPMQTLEQKIQFPAEEKTVIDFHAKRVGVEPELLMAIRKQENGPTYAFGVIPNERYNNDNGYAVDGKFTEYKSDFEKQATWAAWTVKRNMQRFEAAGNKDYSKFIDFLKERYPQDDEKEEWAKNVKYFYNKFKTKKDEPKGEAKVQAKEKTIEKCLSAPYFKDLPENHCARYVRLAAHMHGNRFVPDTNAWDYSTRNQLVARVNGTIEGHEDKLVPGKTAVTFFYPKSKYNQPGRLVTHVALYLGKENGKLMFAEAAGKVQRKISYEDLLKKTYSPREIVEPKEEKQV